MKMRFLSILTVIAALSGLSACVGGTSSANQNEIDEFKIVQTIKSAQRDYLCEGTMFADSLNVYSRVEVAVEWPEQIGNYDIKPLQDSLIAKTFISPKKSLDESIISALDNPQGSDTYKMVRIDSIPEAGDAMLLYHSTVVSSIAFSPRFIVYQILSSSYEGGAHGLTVSNFMNYDLVNGRVVDFDSAFKPGSYDALFDAVKSKLMEDNGVSSLADLDEKGFFSSQLFLSHNFYLQGYDVVFHYHPYDIAPYSTGSVDVRIPFYTISDYLSPEVAEMLSEGTF